MVGSAWTGELPGERGGVEVNRKPAKKLEEGFSSKLMELARKQRMNTDTRRTIFCILMSAEVSYHGTRINYLPAKSI